MRAHIRRGPGVHFDNLVYKTFICSFPERLINFAAHPTLKTNRKIYSRFHIGFQIIAHLVYAYNYNWLTRFFIAGGKTMTVL